MKAWSMGHGAESREQLMGSRKIGNRE